MQEIPRPVTNLSWDNAALMSFATMEKNGLAENDAVEISVGGKKIIAGALAVPGQADGVVVVTLGLGRRFGRVAGGVGYNAYLIQQSGAPWAQSVALLRKTGDIYDICVTKSHHIDQRAVFAGGDGSGTHSIEGNESLDRGIVRYATLTEFKAICARRRRARRARAGRDDVPGISIRQKCLGDVDRSEFVRGLQCVRDGLLCGEQYSGGWPRAG
jgi:molybdopterin-containing oxidoreductase family iron-sulfur binding subunit